MEQENTNKTEPSEKMWRDTKNRATGVKTLDTTEQNECDSDVRAAALLKVAANLATAAGTAAVIKARPVLLGTVKEEVRGRRRPLKREWNTETCIAERWGRSWRGAGEAGSALV